MGGWEGVPATGEEVTVGGGEVFPDAGQKDSCHIVRGRRQGRDEGQQAGNHSEGQWLPLY